MKSVDMFEVNRDCNVIYIIEEIKIQFLNFRSSHLKFIFISINRNLIF